MSKKQQKLSDFATVPANQKLPLLANRRPLTINCCRLIANCRR
jgi:hypothetical protein